MPLSLTSVRAGLVAVTVALGIIIVVAISATSFTVFSRVLNNFDIYVGTEAFLSPAEIFSDINIIAKSWVPVVAGNAIDSVAVYTVGYELPTFSLAGIFSQRLAKRVPNHVFELDQMEGYSTAFSDLIEHVPSVKEVTAIASVIWQTDLDDFPPPPAIPYLPRPKNYTLFAITGFGTLKYYPIYKVAILMSRYRDLKAFRNGSFAAQSNCDYMANQIRDQVQLHKKTQSCLAPWLRDTPSTIPDGAMVTNLYETVDNLPNPNKACYLDNVEFECGDPKPEPRCWRYKYPVLPDSMERAYHHAGSALRSFKSPGLRPHFSYGTIQGVVDFNALPVHAHIIRVADHPSRVAPGTPPPPGAQPNTDVHWIGSTDCAQPPCMHPMPAMGEYMHANDQWSHVVIAVLDVQRNAMFRNVRAAIFGRPGGVFPPEATAVLQVDYGRAVLPEDYALALNRTVDRLSTIMGAAVTRPLNVPTNPQYGECAVANRRVSAETMHLAPALVHEAFVAAHLGRDTLSYSSDSIPSVEEMRGPRIVYVPASAVLGQTPDDRRSTPFQRVLATAAPHSRDFPGASGGHSATQAAGAPLNDAAFAALVSPHLSDPTHPVFRQLALLRPDMLPPSAGVAGQGEAQSPLADFYIEYVLVQRPGPTGQRFMKASAMMRTNKVEYPPFQRGSKQLRGFAGHNTIVVFTPTAAFLEKSLPSERAVGDRVRAIERDQQARRTSVRSSIIMMGSVLIITSFIVIVVSRAFVATTVRSMSATVANCVNPLLTAMGHVAATQWHDAAIMLPDPGEVLFANTSAPLIFRTVTKAHGIMELDSLGRGLGSAVSSLNAFSIYLPAHMKLTAGHAATDAGTDILSRSASSIPSVSSVNRPPVSVTGGRAGSRRCRSAASVVSAARDLAVVAASATDALYEADPFGPAFGGLGLAGGGTGLAGGGTGLAGGSSGLVGGSAFTGGTSPHTASPFGGSAVGGWVNQVGPSGHTPSVVVPGVAAGGGGWQIPHIPPLVLPADTRVPSADRLPQALVAGSSSTVATSVLESMAHLPEAVEALPVMSVSGSGSFYTSAASDHSQSGVRRQSQLPTGRAAPSTATFPLYGAMAAIASFGADSVGPDRVGGVVCIVSRLAPGGRGALGARAEGVNTLLRVLESEVLKGTNAVYMQPCSHSTRPTVYLSVGVAQPTANALFETIHLAWECHTALAETAYFGVAVGSLSVGVIGHTNRYAVAVGNVHLRARAAAEVACVVEAPSPVVDDRTLASVAVRGLVVDRFVALPCGWAAYQAAEVGPYGFLGRLPPARAHGRRARMGSDLAATALRDIVAAAWTAAETADTAAVTTALRSCDPVLRTVGDMTDLLADISAAVGPVSAGLNEAVVDRLVPFVTRHVPVAVHVFTISTPSLVGGAPPLVYDPLDVALHSTRRPPRARGHSTASVAVPRNAASRGHSAAASSARTIPYSAYPTGGPSYTPAAPNGALSGGLGVATHARFRNMSDSGGAGNSADAMDALAAARESVTTAAGESLATRANVDVDFMSANTSADKSVPTSAPS